MAILCNASDIHLRSSKAFGLKCTDNFSIAVWINANWGGAVGARSMVGIYGGTADVPLEAPTCAAQIGTRTGNNELSIWTWGGGVLVQTANNFMTAFNNVWVHVVYTFDGTTHRAYLNGTVIATSVTAPFANQYLNQIYINGYPGGITNEVHNHQVDCFSLYRRTLSPDEILTMYNAQGGRHGIVKDLLCSLEFDELTDGSVCAVVPDLSGSDSPLNITGAGSSMLYSYSNTRANSNIRMVI